MLITFNDSLRGYALQADEDAIHTIIIMRLSKGPSTKYVTLEGEGVREGVTVCDRGEGG